MATTQVVQRAPPRASGESAHRHIAYQQVPLQVQDVAESPAQTQTQVQSEAQPIQVIVVQQQPQPIQQVVVVQNPNANPNQNGNYNNMHQRMKKNGGNCCRLTLIVLWYIALVGAIAQLLLGVLFSRKFNDDLIWITFTMTVPGTIGLIGAPISIFGVSKYNYTLSIFSCVASGLLVLDGLLIFTADDGAFYFVVTYIPPFVWFSCLFSFSIIFTKKVAFAQGQPGSGNIDDGCCSCDGCNDCCNPPAVQRTVYPQPVNQTRTLQVGVASRSTGEAHGQPMQVIAVQIPNANNPNANGTVILPNAIPTCPFSKK